MASSVRKLLGVTVMAVMAGTFAFAGVAAAGTDGMPGGPTPPPDPGCSFSIVVNTPGGVVPQPPGPVSITVSGAIGGDFTGAIVTLLVDGGPADSQAVNASDGSFVFGPLNVPVPSDVSIEYSYGNENAYTNFCIGPGGQSVVRISPAALAAAVARPLAFTGSSDTTRNVLIAIAAIVFGTLLVVGTRRRSSVKA